MTIYSNIDDLNSTKNSESSTVAAIINQNNFKEVLNDVRLTSLFGEHYNAYRVSLEPYIRGIRTGFDFIVQESGNINLFKQLAHYYHGEFSDTYSWKYDEKRNGGKKNDYLSYPWDLLAEDYEKYWHTPKLTHIIKSNVTRKANTTGSTYDPDEMLFAEAFFLTIGAIAHHITFSESTDDSTPSNKETDKTFVENAVLFKQLFLKENGHKQDIVQ